MKKKQKTFFIWLILVVAWNFGIPDARPLYDVLIAVGLSFFLIFLNKQF